MVRNRKKGVGSVASGLFVYALVLGWLGVRFALVVWRLCCNSCFGCQALLACSHFAAPCERPSQQVMMYRKYEFSLSIKQRLGPLMHHRDNWHALVYLGVDWGVIFLSAWLGRAAFGHCNTCLLYTSDAADDTPC
eukprot:6389849-Amphidinium_carterae.1